ncbi:hypothetical protein [Streptomyces sp. NBC_01244]|uniref:hypothetical protein n=1 Tax=Streptomyces sp. NBC_01244 TaxID=2903797 RepID=UPI002E1166A0|nr:hypothetical protein OG247_06640 [Streptomyces sp. NBC_01244]
MISAIALLTAVVLFVRVSGDGRAYRRRMEAGLTAAERLWIRGWCCGRCARVHFEGESAALTLQEFRVRVWTAGGCGRRVRPEGTGTWPKRIPRSSWSSPANPTAY